MLRLVDLIVRTRDLSKCDKIDESLFDWCEVSDIEIIVKNLIHYFKVHSTNIQHLLEDLDKYITELEKKNAVHSTRSEK